MSYMLDFQGFSNSKFKIIHYDYIEITCGFYHKKNFL